MPCLAREACEKEAPDTVSGLIQGMQIGSVGFPPLNTKVRPTQQHWIGHTEIPHREMLHSSLTGILRKGKAPSETIPFTVKTVPTEIQSQKSAEIQSVYVAFHVHAQLQRPVPTETYSPVQSEND